MSIATEIGIRMVEEADAAEIAALHADSWRRHYRGAYSDAYLDGGLDADRLTVWSDRLKLSEIDAVTQVAVQEDRVVGFVHARLDADPTWGTLVDNLHVTFALQRRKIGARLLDTAGRIILERRREAGLYLWVLEQNQGARAFYLSRGGAISGRELVTPPGGAAANLTGTPFKLRIAWPDPEVLMLGPHASLGTDDPSLNA